MTTPAPTTGDLPTTLATLAALESTYQSRTPQTDLPALLISALDHSRTAIALSLSSNSPSHWKRTAQLAVWQYRAFQSPAGALPDLDAAISSIRETIALLSSPGTITDTDGGLQCRFQQGQLVECLLERFTETDERGDIDAAVDLIEVILAGIPAGDEHGERVDMLVRLATKLKRRYKAFAELGDLDRAVAALDKALKLADQDEQRVDVASRLASTLMERFSRMQSEDDFRRIGETLEAALKLQGDNAGLLTKLGGYLLDVGKDVDPEKRGGRLERCIEAVTRALALAVPEDEDDDLTRLRQFHILGSASMERFKSTADLEDADKGIAFFKKAMELGLPTMKAMDMELKMVQAFLARYNISSYPNDLDEAFRTTMAMLDDARVSTYDHDELLWLAQCIGQIGSEMERHDSYTSYIDQAIRTMYVALRKMPEESMDDRLNLLGRIRQFYDFRFQATQGPDDLDNMIRASAEMLDQAPDSDVVMRRTARLHLVSGLADRFDRNGRVSLEDISRAISEMESVLEEMPVDEPGRDLHLEALSGYLVFRFQRSANWRETTFQVGWLSDLDRAISILREVLELTPAGNGHDVSRGLTLLSLSEAYRSRGEYRFDTGVEGHEDDLTMAIETALLAEKIGKADRYIYHGLATLYETKYKLGGAQDMGDLDLAIKYRELSAEEARKENKGLPLLLMMLAGLYYDRALNCDEETEEELQAEVMKKAALCAGELIEMDDCPVLEKYAAVVISAQIHYNSDMLDEAVEIWMDMIDIVPKLVVRSGSYSDQEYRLKGHGATSAQFVSTALMAEYEPEVALRLLEVGRGVIASFLMANRVDVATLGPEQASAFTEALATWEGLRDKVKLADDSQKRGVTGWVSDSQQCQLAEIKLREVIECIQEENEDFLGPPSVEQVRKVLGDDTVVVFNVSDLRCDAFLINNKLDGIKMVELESLTIEDLQRWVARLRTSRPLVDPAMLEWLWTAVAQPVLDELGFEPVPPGQQPPRIIWIPAGPLCHLPIHAAGMHGSGNGQSVMDRAMSSFSPSLKAFLMGRRLGGQDPRQSEGRYAGQSALLIGAGEASARPGLGKLPFVAREIEELTTTCKSLSLNPVTLHDPTRAEVLARISECAIMHFAGHGLTDPLEPSQSGLLMDDGILAVSDLLDARLQSRTPFLAFLSACLTGANDIDQLEDEGVNLTSACQLVGFNHVIGTLWQVSDRTCVEVSQGLYTTLATEGMTSASVCRGLHQAVLRLRDSWVGDGGQTRGGPNVGIVAEDWSGDDEGGEGTDAEEDDDDNDEAQDEEADDAVDSGCEAGDEETGPSQFREAALRLKRRQKPVRNWVRADWIPYVHYGP